MPRSSSQGPHAGAGTVEHTRDHPQGTGVVLLRRIEPAQVVGSTGRPDGMAVMLMAMGLGRGCGLRAPALGQRSPPGLHQRC
jgi:hypothetical protein